MKWVVLLTDGTEVAIDVANQPFVSVDHEADTIVNSFRQQHPTLDSDMIDDWWSIRSDKWGIATDSVEPARMQPGTKMYGIAQTGDTHASIFTEFKLLADRIVELLNRDGS